MRLRVVLVVLVPVSLFSAAAKTADAAGEYASTSELCKDFLSL
jgi:hypothetical protein